MREQVTDDASSFSFSEAEAEAPPQALLERLKDYGQEDVFALWDELSPEDRLFLVKDIQVVLSSLNPQSRSLFVFFFFLMLLHFSPHNQPLKFLIHYVFYPFNIL